MNILMINRDMCIGGGNTFLRNVALPLRQRGHRVFLVSAGGDTRPQLEAAFDGVYTRSLVFPWDCLWLAGLIRKLDIDVVNACAPVQFPAVAAACRRTGVAMVLSLPAPFPARRVERFLPATKAVMVMNDMQRDHFAAMGMPRERIFKSRWIMDWDDYAAHGLPWEERRYDAVYCSRLSHTKGPLAVAFLDAMRSLLPERPKLMAAIVGDGRHMPQVRAAADRLNAAAGRHAVDIVTDVLDTAPLFGDARVVAGGNYASIEGIAAGGFAIGAGYDGIFGLVTPENVEDAAEQYFGDHITPITGVERDDSLLEQHVTAALRQAFSPEATAWRPALEARARILFRREEGAERIEREFEQALGRRQPVAANMRL